MNEIFIVGSNYIFWMPKTMSHKIFAISIIQKLTTAKFCRRKTQPRRQLRRQKLNAVVNSEGCK